MNFDKKFEICSSAEEFLKEQISSVKNEKKDAQRLRVFDFDDTLVITDARVTVTDSLGVKKFLTASELNVYEKQENDAFDYAEFKQLMNPRAISWMCKIMKYVYHKHGCESLVVLSARVSPEPIIQFLSSIGVFGVEVKALNNACSELKAAAVDNWISTRQLNYVEFFDDSRKNIEHISTLALKHKNVQIVTHHLVHNHDYSESVIRSSRL